MLGRGARRAECQEAAHSALTDVSTLPQSSMTAKLLILNAAEKP